MAHDVLYVVSRLRPSGPTNQLYYLLEHLDEAFEPTVLTLSPEPDDTDLPRFQELGVHYETLGLPRWRGMVYGPKRLASIVADLDPDVVHTQGIRADTLSALVLAGYPRIATVRNYPYDDYPAKFGPVQGNAMAWEHLQVLGRVDHLVACSETIARRIEEHGLEATPIQNGVDERRFSPPSDARKRELRAELGVPEGDTVVVSVGSLIPRKDPQTVIEGYGRARLQESTLLFLGDGPLREECESLADGDDGVRFEGWVDDVESYLQVADVFVSASRSEGLPNTVMEALSVGLPVCLSDIEPHREILRYGEDAGRLFELASPDDLAGGLEELATTDLDSLDRPPRSIVEDHLSAEIMASEYADVYRSYVA